MAQLIKLKVGDVLTIDLPDTVVASVDDIPVMLCEFGHSPQGGQRSIRVLEMIDHRSLQGEDTNVLAMLRKAAVEPSDAPLLP
jgi:flagellar motor switch protein FliM